MQRKQVLFIRVVSYECDYFEVYYSLKILVDVGGMQHKRDL